VGDVTAAQTQAARDPASAHVSLAGYERSVQPLQVVVRELRDMLGAQLAAYIADVKETRAVHEWADGTREVRGLDRQQKLRIALRVAVMLAERDSPAVVQAWFQGLNPKLGDHSPARLLREATDVDEVGRQVLSAAQAFSAVG
jgi:hypothetical protein